MNSLERGMVLVLGGVALSAGFNKMYPSSSGIEAASMIPQQTKTRDEIQYVLDNHEVPVSSSQDTQPEPEETVEQRSQRTKELEKNFTAFAPTLKTHLNTDEWEFEVKEEEGVTRLFDSSLENTVLVLSLPNIDHCESDMPFNLVIQAFAKGEDGEILTDDQDSPIYLSAATQEELLVQLRSELSGIRSKND